MGRLAGPSDALSNAGGGQTCSEGSWIGASLTPQGRSVARRRPEFDRAVYRQRNVIERAVGWLKERRRLAAMLYIGLVERCVSAHWGRVDSNWQRATKDPTIAELPKGCSAFVLSAGAAAMSALEIGLTERR